MSRILKATSNEEACNQVSAGPPSVTGPVQSRHGPVALALANWAAWAPGVASRADWTAWSEGRLAIVDDDQIRPDVPEIPMMMRRRLNRLGRMAARVAYDAGGLDDAVIVYCSRYGDSVLTVSLLEDIVAGELPSPAGFSMAVHNSLAGLLSIVSDNRLGHTAVAAGAESLGAGLLEAAMIMADKPDGRVLVLYCHEPLAPVYQRFRRPGEEAVAVALRFGRASDGTGPTLSANPQAEPADGSAELDALSFIRFLLSDDRKATFGGAGLEWAWAGLP